MSDEERYDEEQAKKRKRVGNKNQTITKKRKSSHSKSSERAAVLPQTGVTPTAENEATNGES
jgi:hypothetical protein